MPLLDTIKTPKKRSNNVTIEQLSKGDGAVFTQQKKIRNISTSRIKSYRHQARENFDRQKLEELAASIHQVGIKQPLILIETNADKSAPYEVISGERRLLAAEMAGLESVPAIVEAESEDTELAALIENIQRVDLSSLEFGKACIKLQERSYESTGKKLTYRELAAKLGKSKSEVARCVNYASLDPSVISMIQEQKIESRDEIEQICKIKTAQEQKDFINFLVSESANSMPRESAQKGNRKKAERSPQKKRTALGLEGDSFFIKEAVIKSATDDEKAALLEGCYYLQELIENSVNTNSEQ